MDRMSLTKKQYISSFHQRNRYGKSMFLLMLFVSLLFQACRYEFPETQVEYRAGSLDLTTFVCVGDDFPAGFMDGALYDAGQQHSVAAIVAASLQPAGLHSFNQADIGSLNGYNEFVTHRDNIPGRYALVYPDNQADLPEIITTPGDPVGSFAGDKNLLQDFSVPFMKIYQADDPALIANRYYARIATDPSVSTLLSQADQSGATFFLLWAGMSDILGYAMSGGVGDTLLAGTGQTPGPQDLTPVSLFEEKLDKILSTLLDNESSKGVILTLPSFDDLPFFYYYTYNFIKLPGPMLVLAFSTYTDFNDAVSLNNQDPANPKRPYISFNDNGSTLYPQNVVVVDSTLPDAYYPDGQPLEKIRQLREGEMVLMTFPKELLEYGMGSLIPLPEKYYLNARQVAAIRTRVAAFNEVIRRKSAEYPGRLCLVDITENIHAIAQTGKLNGWGQPAGKDFQYFEGVPLAGRLELNSIYSLDGLHFNQRGNAYIAHEIIETVNTFFQATLPAVDVNSYRGNVPLY